MPLGHSQLMNPRVILSHYNDVHIGVRAMGREGGGGGAAAPLELFSYSHFRAKNQGHIWANPLDFHASNGNKYLGKRLQPPPPTPRTKLIPYAYGCAH